MALTVSDDPARWEATHGYQVTEAEPKQTRTLTETQMRHRGRNQQPNADKRRWGLFMPESRGTQVRTLIGGRADHNTQVTKSHREREGRRLNAETTDFDNVLRKILFFCCWLFFSRLQIQKWYRRRNSGRPCESHSRSRKSSLLQGWDLIGRGVGGTLTHCFAGFALQTLHSHLTSLWANPCRARRKNNKQALWKYASSFAVKLQVTQQRLCEMQGCGDAFH